MISRSEVKTTTDDETGEPVVLLDMTEYHGALDEQGATVDAVRSEGIAVVTWIVDGREARQIIALNPGDFERLAAGHDPVAEQWEDGCGNLVCIENAEEEQ